MKNNICFFGLLHFKTNENNNLNFHDLDDIGISWNPMINLEKYQKNFHDTNRYIPEILFSTLANFAGLIKKGKDEDYLT